MIKSNCVEWLIDIPKKNKNKIFLIDELSNSKITFEQIHKNACSIADTLKKLGFRKGEKLAIFMED